MKEREFDRINGGGAQGKWSGERTARRRGSIHGGRGIEAAIASHEGGRNRWRGRAREAYLSSFLGIAHEKEKRGKVRKCVCEETGEGGEEAASQRRQDGGDRRRPPRWRSPMDWPAVEEKGRQVPEYSDEGGTSCDKLLEGSA